jgi:hypothetical protein
VGAGTKAHPAGPHEAGRQGRGKGQATHVRAASYEMPRPFRRARAFGLWARLKERCAPTAGACERGQRGRTAAAIAAAAGAGVPALRHPRRSRDRPWTHGRGPMRFVGVRRNHHRAGSIVRRRAEDTGRTRRQIAAETFGGACSTCCSRRWASSGRLGRPHGSRSGSAPPNSHSALAWHVRPWGP